MFNFWNKAPNSEYDSVTGVETEESFYRKLGLNKEQLIEEANFVASLKDTQGWKIIDQHLRSRLVKLEEFLIDATDLEVVRRLQEQIKARREILNFIDFLVDEGNSLKEEQAQHDAG